MQIEYLLDSRDENAAFSSEKQMSRQSRLSSLCLIEKFRFYSFSKVLSEENLLLIVLS